MDTSKFVNNITKALKGDLTCKMHSKSAVFIRRKIFGNVTIPKRSKMGFVLIRAQRIGSRAWKKFNPNGCPKSLTPTL